MTTRAATYRRVSTDEQANNYSLDSQRDKCCEYAASQGWQIVAEYRDDESGMTLDRPGLKELRKAAALHDFDVLVVLDTDRLARDARKLTFLEVELSELGVDVCYVLTPNDKSPESGLIRAVNGYAGEVEHSRILERCQRGRIAKGKSGKAIGAGPTIYGYWIDRNDWTYQILEQEAQIVREIFERYAWQGASIRGLADDLNARGIPSPGHEQERKDTPKWAKSEIARMLHSAVYQGRARYNTTQRDKSSKSKGKQKPRPESDWVEIPCPAIVDKRTWEQAKARLQNNRDIVRRTPKHPYLLSGMMRCAYCGKPLGGEFSKGAMRYRCTARCGAMRSTRADQLEPRVWDKVESVMLSPDQIRAEYDKLTDAASKEYAAAQAEQDRLAKRQRELEARKARLLDLYLNGGLDMDTYKAKDAVIAQELADLQRKLARAQEVLRPASPGDFEEIRETLWGNMREYLTLLGQPVPQGIPVRPRPDTELDPARVFDARRALLHRLAARVQLSQDMIGLELSLRGKDGVLSTITLWMERYPNQD